MPQQIVQPVVRDVMRYFVDHPHAADSLEGIARWRLLERRLRETVQETAGALEWLVAHDYVRQIHVAGGQPLYRLNDDKAIDAARLAAAEVR
jgi:hypothetical protein